MNNRQYKKQFKKMWGRNPPNTIGQKLEFAAWRAASAFRELGSKMKALLNM